jgi:hypothetical protein
VVERKSKSCRLLGDVVSLLRIERKFDDISKESNQYTDLFIQKEEIELIEMFMRFVYPSLDRIRFVSDAYDGIIEASKAMNVLQHQLKDLNLKFEDQKIKNLEYIHPNIENKNIEIQNNEFLKNIHECAITESKKETNLAQKLYQSTLLKLNNMTESFLSQEINNQNVSIRINNWIIKIFFEKLKSSVSAKKISGLRELEGHISEANEQIFSLERCIGDLIILRHHYCI